MAGEGTGPGADREEVRPRVWPCSGVGRLLFPLSPPLILTPGQAAAQETRLAKKPHVWVSWNLRGGSQSDAGGQCTGSSRACVLPGEAALAQCGGGLCQSSLSPFDGFSELRGESPGTLDPPSTVHMGLGNVGSVARELHPHSRAPCRGQPLDADFCSLGCLEHASVLRWSFLTKPAGFRTAPE